MNTCYYAVRPAKDFECRLLPSSTLYCYLVGERADRGSHGSLISPDSEGMKYRGESKTMLTIRSVQIDESYESPVS